MDSKAFFEIIDFLSDGCGKSLTHKATNVYYLMLGDLPPYALRAAAMQSLLENLYSAFPSIALLRRLAVEAMAPPQMTAGEAWGRARRANKMFVDSWLDFKVVGGRTYRASEWNELVLQSLPPAVAYAMRCFGLGGLHDTDACRAQFRDMYQAFAAKENKALMLPAALAKNIAEVRTKFLLTSAMPEPENAAEAEELSLPFKRPEQQKVG